jgi:hypothetical protein
LETWDTYSHTRIFVNTVATRSQRESTVPRSAANTLSTIPRADAEAVSFMYCGLTGRGPQSVIYYIHRLRRI